MAIFGLTSNTTIFNELVVVAKVQAVQTTQLVALSNALVALQKQLSAIATAQAAQSAQLAAILTQGNQIMATVADVQADVTAQTTVISSAVTLLQGLSAQLAAAGTDPAALQATKDSLDANTAQLAAAVVANTPGAPPPAQAAQQAQPPLLGLKARGFCERERVLCQNQIKLNTTRSDSEIAADVKVALETQTIKICELMDAAQGAGLTVNFGVGKDWRNKNVISGLSVVKVL